MATGNPIFLSPGSRSVLNGIVPIILLIEQGSRRTDLAVLTKPHRKMVLAHRLREALAVRDVRPGARRDRDAVPSSGPKSVARNDLALAPMNTRGIERAAAAASHQEFRSSRPDGIVAPPARGRFSRLGFCYSRQRE